MHIQYKKSRRLALTPPDATRVTAMAPTLYDGLDGPFTMRVAAASVSCPLARSEPADLVRCRRPGVGL